MRETTQFEQTLQKVREIIAEKTGNEVEDIVVDALLHELNLYGVDLNRIITGINSEFSLEIDPTDIESDAETIQELAMLVHEETYLG